MSKGRRSYITRAFDKTKAKLNYNIIVITKYLCDLASDPSASIVSYMPAVLGNSDELLHNLQVDLLHVHLLTKLGREFGRLQELCINAGRHLELGDSISSWMRRFWEDGIQDIEIEV